MKRVIPKNLYWGKWSHMVQIRLEAARWTIVKRALKENNWESNYYSLLFQGMTHKDDTAKYFGARSGKIHHDEYQNLMTLIEILKVYTSKYGNIEGIRIERDHVSFYTNSSVLFDTLNNSKVKHTIKRYAAPLNESHAQLMKDTVTEPGFYKKVRAVKKYPKGKYRYQIKTNTLGQLIEQNPRVRDLLNGYQEQGQVAFSPGLDRRLNNPMERWIYGTINVLDEETLTMLTLVLGQDHIWQVEEYQLYTA